ncbi:mediator-RNA polymerase II transcription subunit 21 [Fusarium pseudoanthophilum]|uniref:Mediator of RNA polymerase II transcription subunit 21 n=1 Tax=Fusarium pseudoanthophilum TaxID=48495 RepID=A0A8H5NRS4_9HYPO|nr:mediator-RNA polymerase II transcription subunit 21 [Fusarium pseudoanthophilum]
MGDRLTQLQDAVDQLATQFVACLHYVNKRHDLETLGPNDKDLIVKEQQIEVLVSSLPGLDNSEMDQERYIKELEEDLKIAEAQRQEAIKEKDQILSELDSVIRSIRRP